MKEFLLPIITSILISLGIISPISQQANLGAPSFNYIVGTSTMETRFADGSSTTTIKAATSTFAGNVSIIGRTTLFGSLNASSTATTTLSNGIQLYGGCFRDVSGSCIVSGLSAAITSLGGLTGAAQTFSSNDLLTVTSAGTNHHFNASTSPFFGTLTASGTINFTGLSNGAVSVSSGVLSSGTLIVGSGGTGRTTFTSSQLLYGNGAENLSSVATSSASCSGSVSCSAFTVVGSVSPTITSSASLFAWTPRINGNATGTTILLDSGFISSASSTVIGNFIVSGVLNASSTLTVAGNSIFYSNVGIGNTAPLSKLGVTGNASVGATYGVIAAPTSGMIIEGNVGIGTANPTYLLDISGNFRANGIWTNAGVTYWGNPATPTAYGILTWDTGYASIYANSGNVLKLGANGTQGTMIINSGNVGIGTTSPAQLLAVAGDVYIVGTTTALSFKGKGSYLTNIYNGTTTIISAYSVAQTSATECITGSTLSLNTNGQSRIMVTFAGAAVVDSSTNIRLSVKVDGVIEANQDPLFDVNPPAANSAVNMSFTYVTGILSEASHSVCLALYTSAAGTVSTRLYPRLTIMELK